MGHSFLYARQNTGLLWHTAVRPSIHASYDNISHLFPLLLIGHVVTYIVLIKAQGLGASEKKIILYNTTRGRTHLLPFF